MATGKKRAGAGGRPRSGSTTDPREALEPLHVRVGVDQRARWRAAVAECDAAGFDERTESAWVRAGLEAFAEVCAVAVRDGLAPGELVVRLLEQHDRVRVLVAQLEADQARRALTAEEDRIFRAFAPAAWERLSFGGALTLAPSKRGACG
jgi:hypothetical protein